MHEVAQQNKREYSFDQIIEVGKELLDASKDLKCWLFYGNLGSGKTSLIKSICRQLGVDEIQMSSPTFSIINEYQSKVGIVYHADFYRIKSEIELLDLGIEEYLDSGNYCFIEWPEKLGKWLPDKYFRVAITETGPFTRTIAYEKHAREEE